jgi:Tfp pilus assembly protein PilX
MMWYKKQQERGVVSLFTVMFFTILVTVLTVGFVRIMINERRQSTDEDLTTRAYYAAESGVEDAKRALQQYYPNPADRTKLNAATCDAPVGYSKTLSTNLSVGYSCMLMDLNPQDIQATLPGDGTSMQWAIRSQGDATFNKVRISWHNLSDQVDGASVAFRPTGSLNPTYASWKNGSNVAFPAMLRMQMFGYPRSGTFGRAQIDALNRVGFLNPTTSPSSGDFPINTIDANTRPQDTKCTTDTTVFGGYACQATIVINPGIDPGTNYAFMRLKGLYDQNGTKVKIELLNGATVVNTQDAQVTVDVTGRAGDVFRRVQSRVSLPGDTSLLPEFAIESGDDICKRFEVTDIDETLNGCVVR